MKLSLKNIRSNQSLSDETPCYSADLYMDDRKVARVSNRGCGRCDEQYWLDQAAEKLLSAHFEALPEVESGLTLEGGEKHEYKPGVEDWCHTEVHNTQVMRRIKSHLKRKTTAISPKGSLSRLRSRDDLGA